MKTTLRATIHLGPPMNAWRKTLSVNRELDVQIGEVCCALRCHSRDVYDGVRGLYRDFLTGQTPDVSIHLRKSARKRNRQSFKVLSARPGLFIAEVECDTEETREGLRCMDRLFCLAYYSACLEKYTGCLPAMLVNGCGVLRQGRGMLFVGPRDLAKALASLYSEAGSRLLGEETVLVSNPEPVGWGASVQSVPIIGGGPPGINVAVPLGFVLLLKSGSRTRVRPIDPIDAYLRFVREIVTPSCIGPWEIKSALALVADFGQRTIASVPVYEMELADDIASVHGEIEELEGILYGSVSSKKSK